jgi:ABC-2 type transport system ATP-binding protein
MRQRLGIAAALLNRPKLLVLDEPMNGLDPAGIKEMGELITALAKGGASVLLSSHLLDEVERTADRVAVMSAGQVVAVEKTGQGKLADLFFAATAKGAA